MVVISVHIYGVKIIKNSGGKVVFHGTPPPLCTNGSAGYLMQLSVKMDILSKMMGNFRLLVKALPSRVATYLTKLCCFLIKNILQVSIMSVFYLLNFL